VLAARLAASKAKEFFWLNTKSAKGSPPVSSGSSRGGGAGSSGISGISLLSGHWYKSLGSEPANISPRAFSKIGRLWSRNQKAK
jgi:hypothetical protein